MNEGFIPGVLLTFFLMAMLWSASVFMMNDSWRQQIADHGCAEFYLDQNHDRQWKWKECSK